MVSRWKRSLISQISNRDRDVTCKCGHDEYERNGDAASTFDISREFLLTSNCHRMNTVRELVKSRWNLMSKLKVDLR